MLSRPISLPSTTLRSTRIPKTVSTSSKDVLSRVRPQSRVPLRSYHISATCKGDNINIIASRQFTELNAVSNTPPNLHPDANPDSPPEIPDQDWEIRTGRAIYVLQETLPDFFKTGLVTSIDKNTGAPQVPPSLIPTANVNFLEHHVLDNGGEPIYSPNVRLSYTPPALLPSPFPKTFHIEGIQLYLASSTFIRHTMMALYSDLVVENIKLVINNSPRDSSSSTSKQRINRDKSISLRQIVTGTARVTGKHGEWTIESTYTFSPNTGLIHQHIVNSIHPAPHIAVYDSLRLGMGKLLGIGNPAGGAGTAANGAAFKGKIETGKSV